MPVRSSYYRYAGALWIPTWVARDPRYKTRICSSGRCRSSTPTGNGTRDGHADGSSPLLRHIAVKCPAVLNGPDLVRWEVKTPAGRVQEINKCRRSWKSVFWNPWGGGTEQKRAPLKDTASQQNRNVWNLNWIRGTFLSSDTSLHTLTTRINLLRAANAHLSPQSRHIQGGQAEKDRQRDRAQGGWRTASGGRCPWPHRGAACRCARPRRCRACRTR